jgi:hypothetical protein
VSRPETIIDKKSKKKIVTLFDTEKNDWYEQNSILDNIPTVKDIDVLFPEIAHTPKDMPYISMP